MISGIGLHRNRIGMIGCFSFRGVNKATKNIILHVMKIQYCSDLHLEFPENKFFLENNRIRTVGDILILAGDILPLRFKNKTKYSDFYNYLSDSFDSIYWIPGNHEYYHSDISKIQGELNEQIRSNFSIVNNVSVIHGDVRILFSTLWTKISSNNKWTIEQGLHYQSIRFLEEELNRDDQKKVIVATHHVPTFLNYPEKYKGDILNEAFAVELYDLIEKSKIDYWIFGHHHQNIPEFEIGNTKMLTNQLGYVKYEEHGGYENSKVIEI
jgi:predicted phosphohydrolase